MLVGRFVLAIDEAKLAASPPAYSIYQMSHFNDVMNYILLSQRLYYFRMFCNPIQSNILWLSQQVKTWAVTPSAILFTVGHGNTVNSKKKKEKNIQHDIWTPPIKDTSQSINITHKRTCVRRSCCSRVEQRERTQLLCYLTETYWERVNLLSYAYTLNHQHRHPVNLPQ